MERDYSLYSEVFREAKREMEEKHKRLMDEMEHEKGFLEALGIADLLVSENDKLKDEISSLEAELEEARRLLTEEKKQRTELEMKMAEMSKLSANVAKKSPEEDLIKALRIYANRSKRKTPDKRVFAKSAILEIANSNGLSLPQDLAAIIDSLDDEQAEAPVTVNVSAGGINVQQANTVRK